MHLIRPSKFCITFVFHFSWDGCNTQKKWKTKVMQNFGGRKRCIIGDVQVANSLDVVRIQFRPRPNKRALLGTAGLSYDHPFINKRKLALENHFDERKQYWLVQRFWLRRLHLRFDAVQVEPSFLIHDQEEDKRRLYSQKRPLSFGLFIFELKAKRCYSERTVLLL